ncbi:MAG: hypothetical protein KBE07_15410 [Rhodoferax sp.]|nr:hypothetical protein [Rhodoferax sp.]MBP9686029.1 hypothetical protein [Rhodoferax sp.]
MIANTDMHKGNLSSVPTMPLQVVPVYDMLPMLYAPMAGGEILLVRYAPALPSPQDRALWLQASVAACRFWQTAAADQSISPEFQTLCRQNLAALMAVQDMA